MGIRFMMSTDKARNSSTRASQQRSVPCIKGKANLDIRSLETPQPHRAPSSSAHGKQLGWFPVIGAVPRLSNTRSSTQTWKNHKNALKHKGNARMLAAHVAFQLSAGTRRNELTEKDALAGLDADLKGGG